MVRSQEVEMGQIFLSNIFNENGKVVQRYVHTDLIFRSFAYCLTISESSCQPSSTGTQIWAKNSKVN